jgi:ABC-type uncharacterized transport system involved in gliding motility auxiliary subunit
LTSRTARYGVGHLVTALLVAGIVVFAGLLSRNHAVRWDLTQDQRFSLAPQTVQILSGLQADVEAVAFFQGEGGAKLQGKELFDLYSRVSPRFTYRIVDPDRNPGQAKELGVTAYDQVVVQSGGAKEKVNQLSEEKLTNAILRVTKPGKKAVYFITGHGERDIKDEEKNGAGLFGAELEKQNYEVRPLLLAEQTAIPADAALLVLAGPEKDLVPAELDALEKWLRAGGRMLFLLDPETVPGMTAFMAKMGVELGNDVVVDNASRLYGGDYLMPLAAKYTDHPLTRQFNVVTFYPLARSVDVLREKPQGIEVLPLAFTSDQAWAETNLAQLHNEGVARLDKDQDEKGPLPLAVVGTITPADPASAQAGPPDPDDAKAGRFIVFGDSDFITNQFLPSGGNSDLALGVVNWLAEQADQIAIRPKDRKNQPLMLDQMQARLLFWVPVVLLPLFVLGVGVLVIVTRRRG